MRVEEYGIGNDKTIVMLHGAYFVHTFGRQYSLSAKYHIDVRSGIKLPTTFRLFFIRDLTV